MTPHACKTKLRTWSFYQEDCEAARHNVTKNNVRPWRWSPFPNTYRLAICDLKIANDYPNRSLVNSLYPICRYVIR